VALEVQRSVLLPYSAEDMFDLIEQAEHYPSFLPWCTGVTIFERSEEWVAARIEFSYLKVRFGMRTRNPKQRPQWLNVRLEEGPFKRFHGDWTFTQLGDLGCKVNFVASFEISDGILDAIAKQVVDLVAGSMVEAFVKRARATLKDFEPAQALPAPPAQAVEPTP
jgi:ribosome-associated toxin RatA of RatAB toxin-antitoxin module